MNDELGHSVTTFEMNRVPCVRIEPYDLDFATIAAVDESWRVDNGEPLFCGEPAARLHEARIASRYRNGYARSDQGALSGREYVIFGRVQVEPRIAWIRVCGRR